MGIRPVDMQIVVHKTQEIHPAKQSVVSKQDNELQQAQMQNRQTTLRDNQRVNNTEKTELKNLKDDEQKKSKSGNQQSGKFKDEDGHIMEEEKEVVKKLEPLGIHFDMKV
ncbi:MAG: hypothetical protein K8R73_06685 [Clostridiales bacterium]|nr:hypothetical protein [Clostridiales bacterium]